ncbi:MAG: FAD-dependent oxidoreductase [Alphaproteobacteria bacterium]|nr:FAD-dependent oxidoreductase [Alphaproteobacteria bacterium]
MALYIIGAGLSGLSTAYYALNKGYKDIIVFEASNHVGGRCYSFFDKAFDTYLDNGTHLISGANNTLFEILNSCNYKSDELINIGSKLSYFDNNKISSIDMKLKNVIPNAFKFLKLYPLSIKSILNTDKSEANKFLYFNTCLKLLFSKDNNFYLAKDNLSKSIILPIYNYLKDKVEFNFSCNVNNYSKDLLTIKNKTYKLNSCDKIICSSPKITKNFETIISIHYKTDIKLPNNLKMLGLINKTADWLFQKDWGISATISAANNLKNEDIAKKVWDDICLITKAQAPIPSIHRVIADKHATLKQTKNTIYQPNYKNGIYFVGDKTNKKLPCTIEGALLTGKDIINLI